MPSSARPVFVLSAPFCGASVLADVLATHPQLVVLRDLHLLAKPSCGALAAWYRDVPKLQEDMLRAVSDIHLCPIPTLRSAIETDPRRPTTDVFATLLAAGAPKTVVDIDFLHVASDTLRGILDAFPAARFIHLMREPVAQYASYRAAMQARGSAVEARPEDLWLEPHLLIRELFADLPAAQKLSLRLEDLMASPGPRAADLFCWLAVGGLKAEVELAELVRVAGERGAQADSSRFPGAGEEMQAHVRLCGYDAINRRETRDAVRAQASTVPAPSPRPAVRAANSVDRASSTLPFQKAENAPLFVLCTMRSYSSLVCAMLGQHPDLYGLPETNLAVAETIEGVFEFYARRPHGLHGLLRTVAQLEFGEQTERSVDATKAWLVERRDWSTERMFHYLANAVAPRRLVDKSPVVAREMAFLKRLYRMFPDAYFLHLTRHPRPCCASIQRLHERLDEHRSGLLSAIVDPQKVWLRTNQNILSFKEVLAPGQYMTVQGEALLTDLALFVPQIAEWLGIAGDPEAVDATRHPEASPYAHLGPANAAYGNDPDFLATPRFTDRPIPEFSLDGPKDWVPGDQEGFSRQTLKIARQLGYG